MLVYKTIAESLNSGYATDIIYFDFKKAFDSVPHHRLLLKLKSYGISGNLLSWLSSFLTEDCSELPSIMYTLSGPMLSVESPRGQFWALFYSYFT